MSHFPCFNFGISRTQPPSLSVGESDCNATVDSLIFLQFHLPYHDRKVSQKATESILERLKFKNLLGGMPPDPPSHCMFCRARIALGPPSENKEPPPPLQACIFSPCATFCSRKSITYSVHVRLSAITYHIRNCSLQLHSLLCSVPGKQIAGHATTSDLKHEGGHAEAHSV